jgi:exodeoxyribonuclease-3
MKIVSWNINSIRVRAEQLRSWIIDNDIEVVLLQETKCVDEQFPTEFFEEVGYNVALFGQKSYNGVAILSKYMIEEVIKGNEIFKNDNQARYIEALINSHTLISVYVPNGVAVDSADYFYKLQFLENLSSHLAKLDKFVIGGDFNIALTNDDVYDPKLWYEKICCSTKEREALYSLIKKNMLIDCVKKHNKASKEPLYTWWNYRFGFFSKDNGLRLDYIFASHNVFVENAKISREIRASQRPSDHAPIIVNINL